MNRRMGVGAAVSLFIFLAAACTDAPPLSPVSRDMPYRSSRSEAAIRTTLVPGAYVVSLRDPGGLATVRRAARALGATVRAELPQIGALSVSNLKTTDVPTLGSLPEVVRITPDYLAQWISHPAIRVRQAGRAVSATPRAAGTDQSGAFFYDDQWNIRQIEADQAWRSTPAGSGELVCILDSGIDPRHSDLAGRIDMSKTKSFVSMPLFPGDLEIFDYFFHGSWVAGIISTNGLGVASVASDAKLCALKVMSVDGSGMFGDLIAAIVYAGVVNADVINMSLGVYVDTSIPGIPDLIEDLQRAIDFATNMGSLVVAAAGNDGINLDHDHPNLRFIPAQMRSVLSVGATAPVNQHNFDRLASYSNYGGRTGIDLVAPGGEFAQGGVLQDLVVSVCSSYQITLGFQCGTADYIFAEGTSASAPHVTGAAAVVESRLGQRPAKTLERCLKLGTDALSPDEIFGTGRLNVLKASHCS